MTIIVIATYAVAILTQNQALASSNDSTGGYSYRIRASSQNVMFEITVSAIQTT